MSVTIFIKDDTDESIVEEFDCMYCEDLDNPNFNCHDCHGEGKVVFKESQWEMNLSNFNFPMLWEALSVSPYSDKNMVGEITPKFLLERIGALPVPTPQISKYLPQLRRISEEAQQRNQLVLWG